MNLDQKIAGFLANTRQNFKERETKTFALGDTLRWELPKVGLISRAWIRIFGTLTLTDADASMSLKDPMDGKPFGMGKMVRISINNGAEPVLSPLYQLYLRQLVSGRSQFPDVVPAGGNADMFVSTNPVYQFAVAAAGGGTANAVDFTVELPIGINERDPLGLLLLQNPDTIAVVEVDTATDTDMFTQAAGDIVAWSGRAVLYLELMNVPDNPDFLPPITKLHRLKFYKQAIATTGDNTHGFTPGNIMLRSIERVMINGARCAVTDVEQLQMVLNDGIVKDNFDYAHQLYLQRMRYGRDLPLAVHVHDFMIQGIAGYGGTRDWVDTSTLTEFAEVVTIGSAVVLGSNNNFLERLVEELAPLAAQ